MTGTSCGVAQGCDPSFPGGRQVARERAVRRDARIALATCDLGMYRLRAGVVGEGTEMLRQGLGLLTERVDAKPDNEEAASLLCARCVS